ncbi:hypothetical protein ABZ871_23270 [Streptomyces populi]
MEHLTAPEGVRAQGRSEFHHDRGAVTVSRGRSTPGPASAQASRVRAVPRRRERDTAGREVVAPRHVIGALNAGEASSVPVT